MCLLCLVSKKSGFNVLEDKFPKALPPLDMTFFLPDIRPLVEGRHGKEKLEMVVDSEAYRFLPTSVQAVNETGSTRMFPLLTQGDGNCLLRAVSRAMWGSEYWHALLRSELAAELERHPVFYKEYFGRYDMADEGEVKYDVEDDEWERILKEARATGGLEGFLQGIHIFALCHVIRRPIILFASDQLRERRGGGVAGVAGTYLPIRLAPEECASKQPVAIAWANAVFHHYVPLVGMASCASPVWPLMEAAWRSFAEKMDQYIHQPSGHRLEAEQSAVLKGFESALSKQKQELQDTLFSAKATHPQTGEKFDHIVCVLSRFYCGFNKGDSADQVVDAFVQSTPELGQLPDKDFNHVLTQLRSMVQNTLTGRVDGSKSETPGVCDCGFRHWLDSEEFDFVVDIGSGKMVGWNWGDDLYAATDRFLDGIQVEGARHSVLLRLLYKERESICNEMCKQLRSDENPPAVEGICMNCKGRVRYGRFDATVQCPSCKEEVVTENAYRAKRSLCARCTSPMYQFDGQKYLFCASCTSYMVRLSCSSCKSDCYSLAGTGRAQFVCPKCSTKQPTGWPARILREQDAAKRMLPMTKWIFYDNSSLAPKILGAIQKSNAAVSPTQALSDVNMAALQQMMDAKALTGGDLTGLAQLVIHQLLVWPPAHRFAPLDALRVLLLNRPTRAHNPLQTLQKIMEAGWKEGEAGDWRCRFNALKCVCNLLPQLQNDDAKALASVWDQLLSLVNQSCCHENLKGHEIVASAQVVLNLTLTLRQCPSLGEEHRNQVVTCLLTSFLPRAVAYRKKAFQAVLDFRRSAAAGTVLTKELTFELQKADEASVLFLQAIGNIQLATAPDDLKPLFDALNAEGVLQEMLDVDAALAKVYEGDKIPLSCGVVRSLLREVMFLELA